jgi:hypothetical protein
VCCEIDRKLVEAVGREGVGATGDLAASETDCRFPDAENSACGALDPGVERAECCEIEGMGAGACGECAAACKAEGWIVCCC